MQLRALALCVVSTVGIVASGLVACTEPAPPPPTSGSAPGLATAVCTPTPAGLVLNAKFLKVSFDPTAASGGPVDAGIPVSADVQQDLNAALNSAGPFQRQLCNLDGIFIDPTGCTTPSDPHSCAMTHQQIAERSWGLRTYPPDPNPGRKYVALSLGLWNNTNPIQPWSCPPPQQACAPPFKVYKNALIRAVLKKLSDNAANDKSAPFYKNVNPNTAAMTVLAALSHEYGHVLWWDTFVQPPGAANVIPGAPTSFCDGSLYPPGLWSASVDLPPNRWVLFGKPREVPSGAEILAVQTALKRGTPKNPKGFRDAGDDLDRLLSGGRWASVLASFSPDEEFVEAFELHVLKQANPPLRHKELVVTGNHGQVSHDAAIRSGPASLFDRGADCFP